MAHTKNKNRRKPKVKNIVNKKSYVKIYDRHRHVMAALASYSINELVEIYKTKMSKTDRHALENAIMLKQFNY